MFENLKMFFGSGLKYLPQGFTLELIVNSLATCITCKCKMHTNKCTLENANKKVHNAQIWVDANYNGSLFASLWTFHRVYYIQMTQTHCKIINLTKIFIER